MRFFALAIVVFMLLFLADPATSCVEQERLHLLEFLAGLSQSSSGLAASWRGDKDCCEWEGITCSGDRAVAELSLPSRGIQGRISPSLAGLTGLMHLNLSHNLFSGDLPMELMYSGSIIVLDVSFNQLNGLLHEPSPSLATSGWPLQVLNISSNQFIMEFPSATWIVMKNLVALNASNNSFTGRIPSSLCHGSPSLAMLDLCYNRLSGDIPAALGDCSKLKVLKAGHNNLGGVLPGQLFHATSLEYLSFPSSGLQGELDGPNLASLSNLAVLDLGGNNFSGKLPDSIGQIRWLEELHLGKNNISGEVPLTLGNCTQLRTIDLKTNNFSGDLGKVNFSTLHNLRSLDLMRNKFNGVVPESIYSCRNLATLRLAGNYFHGEISPRILNLKHLSFLSLTFNYFTNITKALHVLKSCRSITIMLIGRNFMNEAMPQDTIDGFQKLQYLSMKGSALTGEVPTWLSRLRNLKILDLSNNRLTGVMPCWINSLNQLFRLDVSNNSLSGQIPITLMEMPTLKSNETSAYLDLDLLDLRIFMDLSHLEYRIAGAWPKLLNLGNNKFTGVIPPEIGNLKALLSLNLSFNNLYGEFTWSICDLTNLQVLDLSNNHLTGAIPATLENLHFLSTFNISNNDLEGPIPTGGQLSTFPSSSFDGNPKLCGSMLTHRCDSVEEGTVSIVSAEKSSYKVIFVVAFCVFFGVGVLYDQLVLFRYIFWV